MSSDSGSPWPLALAFGLAVAEVGIFLGFAVVAAPGVVFFGASLAGAIDEAGYGRSRPYLLAAIAVAIAVLGIGAVVAALPVRGYAMGIGAVLLLPLAAVDQWR